MIYNLMEYLRLIYTTDKFYVNWSPAESEYYIQLIELDGTENTLYQTDTVQIFVKQKDTPTAKYKSEEIYARLIGTSSWGFNQNLLLPAVAVSSELTYPAVNIISIMAVQKPTFSRIDDNNDIEYTMQLTFSYKN